MALVGELMQGGESVGEKRSRALNHVGVARHRRRSPLGNGKSKNSSAGKSTRLLIWKSLVRVQFFAPLIWDTETER